jgi:hypothetical protein
MAKKKLSRKELKEQKRQTIEGVRQERAWEPPEAGITSPPTTEVVQDMATLFGNSARPTPRDLEVITRVVTESDVLVAEAEFEEVLFDPMQSVNLYIAAAEARGITPEIPDETEDEAEEGIHEELLVEVAEALVTPDVRQEILAALDNLRLRYKEEGKRQRDVAEVAALQVALQSGMSKTSEWAAVPLIQAITAKSVEAGFELVAKTNEFLEQAGVDLSQYETLNEMFEATGFLAEGEQAAKLVERLQQVPGLANYLEKQSDEVWSAGINNLFQYELMLGLYTDEEVAEAASILESFMENAEGDPNRVFETAGEALMAEWQQLVRRIFSTPERLEEARTDVREALEEGYDLEEQDVYFIQMAIEALDDEDAVENEIGLLTAALIGEMRWQAEAGMLDDDWEEEE